MKISKLLIQILIILLISNTVFATQIITSVEIGNQTLIDPLPLTPEPYNTTRQDFYEIKIDTLQFTRIDQLNLGDRIEFKLENFDFQRERFSIDTHNVVIASAKENDALIYIYSEPIQTILFRGVIEHFDITGNGRNDISLRYDGLDINTNQARLNIMRFNDEEYRIYGNTFCQKTNSEFECVEVMDKQAGTFQRVILNDMPRLENGEISFETSDLVEVIQESRNETEVIEQIIEEPQRTIEPTSSLYEQLLEENLFLYLTILGALFLVLIVSFIWKKGRKKRGSEIFFDD